MRLVIDARTAAFGASIDSTTLVGPGGDASTALTAVRTKSGDAHGWTTGLLTVPASRLLLLGAAATAMFRHGDAPIHISVVADLQLGESMSAVLAFQQEMSPAVEAVRIVVPVGGVDEIGAAAEAAASLDQDTACFFDIPGPATSELVSAVRSSLSEVGRSGGFAVSRSTTADVAAAVWEGSYGGAPFVVLEASAGPYTQSTIGGPSAGIVNTIIAAAATESGEPRDVVDEIVADTNPDSFSFGAASVGWQGLLYSASAITEARRRGPLSFGNGDPAALAASLAALGALGSGD